MANKKATQKEMIEAIRSDALVGRGTCSMVDNCRSDDDLVCIYDLGTRVVTIKAAIEAARDDEEFDIEMSLNARWGEDSDPQIIRYKEWKESRKNNPVTNTQN